MSSVDTIFQVLGTIMDRNESGSDIKPDLLYLDHLLTRELHDSHSDLNIADPEAAPEPFDFQSQGDYFAPNVRRMVDRFLAWKLPKNFSPDGFVKFDSESARNSFYWPSGTNILDSEQAREMFMHALDYQKDSVIGEIEAERYRQIYEEGHTFRHDDEHDQGELYRAAICYMTGTPNLGRFAIQWPWEMSSWKPSTDRRKDLIKAAALLVAEIERLDRRDKDR